MAENSLNVGDGKAIFSPESGVEVSLVGVQAHDTQKHFDFLLGINGYSIG